MKITFKITLVLTLESDGAITVTCRELPEFLTYGFSFDEALKNVKDAFIATLEIYGYSKRPLPDEIIVEQIDTVENLQIYDPKFTTISPKGRRRKDSHNLWFQAAMPASESQCAL